MKNSSSSGRIEVGCLSPFALNVQNHTENYLSFVIQSGRPTYNSQTLLLYPNPLSLFSFPLYLEVFSPNVINALQRELSGNTHSSTGRIDGRIKFLGVACLFTS